MKWHPKKSVNTFYSSNFPCFVSGRVEQYAGDQQPLPGCLFKGFKRPLALRFRYLSAQCLQEGLKIQKNRPKAVVFEAAGCAVAQAQTQTLELIALLAQQRGPLARLLRVRPLQVPLLQVPLLQVQQLLLVPQRGQRLLLCCHKRSKQTRQSRLPKSQFFS